MKRWLTTQVSFERWAILVLSVLALVGYYTLATWVPPTSWWL